MRLRGNYQEPTCKPPTQARVQEAQKDLVTLGKFLYVPSQQPWFWVDESRSVFYHLKGYSHLINCCSRLLRPATGHCLTRTFYLAITNRYLPHEFECIHGVRNVVHLHHNMLTQHIWENLSSVTRPFSMFYVWAWVRGYHHIVKFITSVHVTTKIMPTGLTMSLGKLGELEAQGSRAT